MGTDWVCPGCGAGQFEKEYDCCNDECNGEWGTGCYHCHHPSYYPSKPERRLFLCIFPNGTAVKVQGARGGTGVNGLPSESFSHAASIVVELGEGDLIKARDVHDLTNMGWRELQKKFQALLFEDMEKR